MSNAVTLLAYEVLQDGEGASRLAAAIQAAGGAVVASSSYGRQSAVANVVACLSASGTGAITAGGGTLATVVGATFEIESQILGLAAAQAFINTQAGDGNTHLQVFRIDKVNSGSAFLTVVMSN